MAECNDMERELLDRLKDATRENEIPEMRAAILLSRVPPAFRKRLVEAIRVSDAANRTEEALWSELRGAFIGRHLAGRAFDAWYENLRAEAGCDANKRGEGVPSAIDRPGR